MQIPLRLNCAIENAEDYECRRSAMWSLAQAQWHQIMLGSVDEFPLQKQALFSICGHHQATHLSKIREIDNVEHRVISLVVTTLPPKSIL